MHAIRLIGCPIYPQVMSLDAIGPMQVFASANTDLERQGRPPSYQIHLLADVQGPVKCSGGFSLVADRALDQTDPCIFDTILVPGGPGVDTELKNPRLLSWLVKAEPVVRRLGSVCSGALILAAAGFLDGRRATTHWERIDTLRRGHPLIQVEPDCLHTFDPASKDDSHIFTSAGVTSGIDLALALVEQDLGRSLALSVARRLIVYMQRPGGQAQFSSFLCPDKGTNLKLASLLEWIPTQLGGNLSVDVLSDYAGISPRTLTRLFQKELRQTPAAYVEKVRIEAAMALLSHNQASVSTVAKLCGFGHPETLRRAFHRHLVISPGEYKERFGLHQFKRNLSN